MQGAEKKKKKPKKRKQAGWDDRAKNRWVYVTGLPPDITEKEVKNLIIAIVFGLD